MPYQKLYGRKRKGQSPQNFYQVVELTNIYRYPSAAQQHVHVAKGYLPVDVVKALSNDSALVQRAVETFYTRDALQLRVIILCLQS